MSNGSAETKAYKKAQVLDILRKHPGELLTSVQISKFLEERGINTTPNTVKGYGGELVDEYTELTAIPRHGYIWAKEESEFYANKAEETKTSSAYRKKSTVMRNSEGYSDLTAGTAIKNTEGDDPYSRLGEVWSVKGANGLVEWFMILSDWGAVRIGLPLYSGDYQSRIRVKVDVAGSVLYGDATNLRSKPSKYFDTYMGNVEDKKARVILNDVLKAVCDPDISPVVVEAVMPANTIEVDGVLYTEADVKCKIGAVDTLKVQNAIQSDDVNKLSEDLAAANAKITELNNTINSLREALVTARKIKPMAITVDGEVYNEEDIKDIIRNRNTIRVGDMVYTARDICELLENKDLTDPAPDTTVDVQYLAMQHTEWKIYKQFFDAYCQGLAKGDIE